MWIKSFWFQQGGGLNFDATSNSGASTSFTSLSWSHTCTGSNRILIVGSNIQNNTDANGPITGITYGGVALTKIRSDQQRPATVTFRTELWYLIAPATGANTLTITYTGSVTRGCAGAISLTNADQSSQPDAHNGATGDSTTPSVSVTTVKDQSWIIDAVQHNDATTFNSANTGQFIQWNIDQGTLGSGGGSYRETHLAGIIAMGWTQGTSDKWTISAASFKPLGVTAAITGTITSSTTETDIVNGGKTIIITLSNDTWVATGATFDAQRANIIQGLDSAQSELTGWNNEVRDKEVVGAVIRTSDTVVTITLSASASYNITANETITVTVPATAATGGNAIIATPTFNVTFISAVTLKSWRMLLGVGI